MSEENELPPVDFSDEDVGAFVRAVTDEYFPLQRNGTRANTATPLHMMPLLDFMETVRKAAAHARAKVPVGLRDPQWKRDFDAFSERLAGYRKATREAIEDGDGDGFPQPWGQDVILPVLLGWYPGAQTQSVLDAATPLSLQRQAEVSEASMQFAWSQLGRDLSDQGQTVLGPAGAVLAAATGNPIRWGSVLRWTAIAGASVGAAFGVRALLLRSQRRRP